MKKALNITVMLLVLMALAFSLISCNGEAEEKVNEVLGTDVKLNGTWKSEPISYRHDGKDYSGSVELRFNDTQLQIVAPHGTSKIHRYTRSGITLTITDAYAPEDNPFKDLPFGLEFAGGGFSVDLGGLTFTEGMSNIKQKFTKTSDSATIKDPDSSTGGDLPSNPDEPSGSVRVPTEQEFIESVPGYFVAPTEGLQIADEEIICLVSEAAEIFYLDSLDSIDYIEDSVTEEHLVIFDSESPSIKGTILVKPTTRGPIYDKGPVTISGRLLVEDDEYVFDDLSFANFSFTKVLSGNVYLNGVKIEGDSLDFNGITGGYSANWNYAAKVIESASFQYMNGDGVFGQYTYSGKDVENIKIGFIEVVKDGRLIQILCPFYTGSFYTGYRPSAVAVDEVFYDPDFVWRTQTKIIRCPESVSGEFVIPDGITSIGENAFEYCTNLTSVTIPDSVTSIGKWAFAQCTGLTNIVIPDSVTSIGDYAFYECTDLTSVTFPEGVSSIGPEAFHRCTSLTEITYGGTIEQWYALGYELGYGFDNVDITCRDGKAIFKTRKATSSDGTEGLSVYGLTSYGKANCNEIAIPEGITSIGENAFEYCTSLTSVTIPDSVTSIGNHAFYECTGLTSVTIPASVTSIGDWAFCGCSGLTSITIPESLTSFGNYAFSRCTSLTEITYGGTIEQWYALGYELGYGFDDVDITCRDGKAIFRIQKGISDGTEYTSVNGLTPYGKANCTEIAIPEGVTEIGYYAFSGCTGLAGITIPSSVTKIGYSAFSGCNGLTSITIPASVMSIGDNAFFGCNSLTSVTIPLSVTSIGESAFYGCEGLTSITIPDSVTSIGEWAFYGCTSLTDIYVNQEESSLLANASVPYGCRIHWSSTEPGSGSV